MAMEHLPHLFVEGKTDKYVIVQLLKNCGLFAHDGDSTSKLSGLQQVHLIVRTVKPVAGSSGSKTELLSDLSQRIRAPKHRALGYIFDADDPAFSQWNLSQTWHSIRERLMTPPATISSPEYVPKNGFIGHHSSTDTPIGVWLMPDNERDGDIEDFLRMLIADDDQIAPFADACTHSAKADHGALFGDKDFKKAVIQAWLAWQEEPGMTFGTAFQKDCLRKNASLAEQFVTWVKRLTTQNESRD